MVVTDSDRERLIAAVEGVEGIRERIPIPEPGRTLMDAKRVHQTVLEQRESAVEHRNIHGGPESGARPGRQSCHDTRIAEDSSDNARDRGADTCCGTLRPAGSVHDSREYLDDRVIRSQLAHRPILSES